MTTSDDVYVKLANVTQQLGEERTKNDRLSNDNKNLREDIQDLSQQVRDLRLHIEQLKEKYSE